MENLFLVLALCSLLALMIGLAKPSLVIKWGSEETKKRKKVIIIFGSAIIIFFTLFGITLDSSPEKELTQQPENNKSKTLSIGEDGILNNQKEKTNCKGNTILATSKENYDEFSEGMVVEDKLGYLQMVGDEKLFFVKNCTKVKVIDSTFALKEVRILEGEYFGISGWTAYEFAIKE